MAERALAAIEAEARARWSLQASLIVHRYGCPAPHDQIMVATAASHRSEAFEAAEFLMDYLKSGAVLKKQTGPDGNGWVEARDSTSRHSPAGRPPAGLSRPDCNSIICRGPRN